MSQVISAPRPCFQPKLGHDLREIHATEYRQKGLAPTARDPELKHKLNSTQVGKEETDQFQKQQDELVLTQRP